MPKGYGFQEDSIFKKPSNTVTQSPLNVAMNNQPGATVNLGANNVGASLGQASNNLTGTPSPSISQGSNFGNDITSKPDWKDDVKQDEMSAGADDPFEAIKEDTGTTSSTTASTQPGAPQGDSVGANFGNEETPSGSEWDNPLGIDVEALQGLANSGGIFGGQSVFGEGTDFSMGGSDLFGFKSAGATVTAGEDAITDDPDPIGGGGGDGSGGDGTTQQQTTTQGTDVSSILSSMGYDADALREEYGEMFQDYDPTREGFVERGLDIQQQQLDLAKSDATLGLERQQGQLGRQAELLQSQLGPEGYLAQALGRQQASLGLQEKLAQDQLGFAGRAQGLAEQRTDIQRGLTTAEQGFAKDEFGRAIGRIGMQMQAATEAEGEKQSQIADQLAASGIDREQANRIADLQLGKVGRAQESLGLQEEGAIAGEAARQADLGRSMDLADLARGDIQRQADFQLGELGRQEADIGRQITTTTRGAQAGLLDIYDQARDTGGFAGAGARNVRAQRAVQRYTGDVGGRLASLRGQEAGLAARQGQVTAGLESDLARSDISRQGIEAQSQELAGNLQRQLDQFGITGEGYKADIAGITGEQQEKLGRIGIREGALGRQQDLASSLLERQLAGLSLDTKQAQTSYDRKTGQLGAQLSGYDLADKASQLQFDQTSGRLQSQLGQYGIQGEGLTAAYNQQTERVGSQLEGLQSELGPEGFLKRAYDSRIAGMDLGFEQRELGAEEDIFGLQQDFKDKIEGRLIDLIRAQVDLDPYKTGADDENNNENTTTSKPPDSAGMYDGQKSGSWEFQDPPGTWFNVG